MATAQVKYRDPDVQDVVEQHLAWLARCFGRPDYLPLTPDDLAALASCAELIRRFPRTHLFRPGEPATSAYLIKEGQVDIYHGHPRDPQVVARVGPGSVIGDIAMFGDGVYRSSARAVDHVRAFRFERSALLPELAKHPSICLRWLVSGLNQLEQTQKRIIQLMRKSVLAQVADLLAEEAMTSPAIGLSQASIATLLGVSRQSVNESLAKLKEQGVVTTGYRLIKVLDPEALELVASEQNLTE
ncbi:MAG: Crp/Fnr family transcriptional regulator [Acidimicrobiia bacterium]